MMQVKDVMTRTAAVISPNATLTAAAAQMNALGAGLLPVQHERGLVGVISDCDITARAVAHGLDPRTTRVGEVMTPGILTCLEEQTVEEAVGKMRIYRTSRLLVLDRAGQPAGSVSLDDLVATVDASAARAVTRPDRSLHFQGHGFQRILVALDGSEFAERILPLVESVARNFDSTVTLIQSVDAIPELVPAELSLGVIGEDSPVRGTPGPTDERRAHALRYLATVRQTLEDRGLRVELDCTDGSPSQALLRRARQLGVDLIAITTHGRTGVDRTLFGSVAEEVLRHAPCPVLLVRVHDGHECV